jgi:hypothetical protein
MSNIDRQPLHSHHRSEGIPASDTECSGVRSTDQVRTAGLLKDENDLLSSGRSDAHAGSIGRSSGNRPLFEGN